MWAWAGCILICLEETAGCEENAGAPAVAHAGQTLVEPLCPDTCAPVNPAAFRERLKAAAPAPAAGPEAVRFVDAAVSLPFRGYISRRNHFPPTDTSPLFIRFHNFRI